MSLKKRTWAHVRIFLLLGVLKLQWNDKLYKLKSELDNLVWLRNGVSTINGDPSEILTKEYLYLQSEKFKPIRIEVWWVKRTIVHFGSGWVSINDSWHLHTVLLGKASATSPRKGEEGPSVGDKWSNLYETRRWPIWYAKVEDRSGNPKRESVHVHFFYGYAKYSKHLYKT